MPDQESNLAEILNAAKKAPVADLRVTLAAKRPSHPQLLMPAETDLSPAHLIPNKQLKTTIHGQDIPVLGLSCTQPAY